MIVWREEFEVGIPSIDQQHKTFISRINDLEKIALATNPRVEDARFILVIIDFIEDYAKNHFQHEEKCMERFRCPAHAHNQQQHQNFLGNYRRLKERWIREGYSPQILAELLQMTTEWVENHILKTDRQLRHCTGG